MAADLTNVDNATDGTTQTTYTFTGLSFGAEAADRRVVVSIVVQPTAGVGAIVGATIGGVPATIVQEYLGSSMVASVLVAHVPTGATGNVVIEYDGSCWRASMHVHRLTGSNGYPVLSDQIANNSRGPCPADGAALNFSFVPSSGTVGVNISNGGSDSNAQNVSLLGSATASLNVATAGNYVWNSSATTGTVLVIAVAFDGDLATNTAGVDGGYAWHKFLASGDFIASEDTLIEVLLVAGGGASGDNNNQATSTGSGGGGGGGVYKFTAAVAAGTYPVVVGAGGAVSIGSKGGNGGDSSFAGRIAYGGGGGGYRQEDGYGKEGGSGGGAGYKGIGGRPLRENRSSQQGQAGGGDGSVQLGGGGGGGAGAVGLPGVGNDGGAGGDGLQFAFDGTPTYYAGGGAGGTQRGTIGIPSGGLGGGGDGGDASDDGVGTPGVDGLGGGGGGMTRINVVISFGRWGGDGVVFIRYLTSPPAIEGGTEIDLGGGIKARKFTPKDGGLMIHSGSIDVEYLLVAGGGGPGNGSTWAGGGGGAGGLLTNYGGTKVTLTAGTYPVVVGEGGMRGASGLSQENGEDTVFNALTAIGGGAGGGSPGGGNEVPQPGGSGGGGYDDPGGAGTPGQGYAGGTPDPFSSAVAGGGGAGGVGGNGGPTSAFGGEGGVGVSLDIDGTSRTYATGGKGRGEGEVLTLAPGVDGLGDGSMGQHVNDPLPSVIRGGDGILVIRYLEGSPPAPTGASSGSRMLIGCSY
jgi:hypothetical protein